MFRLALYFFYGDLTKPFVSEERNCWEDEIGYVCFKASESFQNLGSTCRHPQSLGAVKLTPQT